MAELRYPYFPPLFVGTERERRPETVRALGFSGPEHIEGMDFPANSVGSVYPRQEAFALVVRDTLNVLFDRFRSVAVVDGHAAEARLPGRMNTPTIRSATTGCEPPSGAWPTWRGGWRIAPRGWGGGRLERWRCRVLSPGTPGRCASPGGLRRSGR